MRLVLPFAFLLMAPLAACSGDDPDATGTGTTGAGAGSATSAATGATTGAGGGSSTGSGAGGTGGVFDPGGELTTFDSVTTPITVQPGDEATVCMTVSLANGTAALVRRFRAELSEGSHHLIIYRSKATQASPEPVPCGGFSGLFGGEYPIFIAQQAAAELVMPTDLESGLPVAFEIGADQMLRFELHYINVTPQPIEVAGDVHFDTVPLDTQVIKSDLAFWGTLGIDIGPNASFDTGVKFQKGLADTSTFALTTHQHQYGTRMRVWHAANSGDTSTLVADGTDWANPPLESFNPPLAFDGSNGLAYQCEYQNTSSSHVGFGEGFNDEMCFLWHYYYPSQGFQYCVEGICQKQPAP